MHAPSSSSSNANAPFRFTWSGIRRGFNGLSPMMVFVIPFGMAFAVSGLEAGMSALQVFILSGTVFAGASQFAVLELWHAPLPYLSIALVAFAVNARHMILGAALAPWINTIPWRGRLPTIFLLSDPNFADSYPRFKSGERDVGILLGGGLLLWVAWMIGVTVGILVGSGIGDMSRFGLDMVMGCYFMAVVVGQLQSTRSHIPAVAIAAIIAVLSVDILPTGWNIIAGALAGGLVGALRRAD